jgi:hypothetical protein
MPDEQSFMCRSCFREHQEAKNKQREARRVHARRTHADACTAATHTRRMRADVARWHATWQERDKLKLAKLMKFGEKARSRFAALRCAALLRRSASAR